MAMFSVRVPDDLAERFDAAASQGGGRSVMLRVLIASAVGSAAAAAGPPARTPSSARLMVRLGALEAAYVEAEAAAMGLRRATWVAALVRRHAVGRPTLARRGEVAVLAIQAEVHRIGVNVNQIARALNTAVLEGRVLDLELSEVQALQRELRSHLLALRAAFEGNLAYWDVSE